MPELEDVPQTGVPAHLQEYFAGIAGVPAGQDRSPQSESEIAVTSPSRPDELNQLRRQLKEKDHAIFLAVLSATDLKQQLDDTKAETETLKTELALVRQEETAIANASTQTATGRPELSSQTLEELNRQRKEFLKIQKSLEREHARRKAELVQVRGQWFQTQQQLEVETKGRRMEAAQASAKIATLERTLTTANTALSNSYREDVNSTAKRSLAIAIASVTLIAAAGAAWTQFPASASSPAASATVSSVIRQPAQARSPSALSPLTQSGFQGSLSHLNRALSSFGQRAPQDVLQDVSRRAGDPSLCAFQWNNGQPAMLYGSDGVRQTLGSSLERCALAVEQMK